MKTLVFGGNGFIGSHLVDQLLEANHDVRVFDRAPEAFRPPLRRVDYHTAEFGDSVAMAEALEGIEIVFHCISTTVPSTSNRDPVADIESNLVGTVRLLDQLVKAGVKRIVYLSSGGTIYGNSRVVPIPEDHPMEPLCSYGVVKMAVEKYLYMYQQLYGIEPVVLRPSNPYGPRQGHRGVQGFLSTALYALSDRAPLTIWGDGSVARDYIYVSDLAELCVKAGMSDATGVYNAGSGIGHSLNDIIEIIGEAVGQRPDVKYKPSRTFDIREVVLDNSSAQATFPWRPRYDLRTGIRKTWEWIQEHHESVP